MQNNNTQIFDGFISSNLENTVPDMMLFDKSFTTFLLERKEKKKKRKWFFWLFLLLFVLPFSYYIIPKNKNSKTRMQVITKRGMSINTSVTSNFLNTATKSQKNILNSTFVKQKKINNSLLPDIENKNSAIDLSKSQQNDFSDKPNLIQQHNNNNKTTTLDSSILSDNALQKNIKKAVDSLLKKKGKTDIKVDTFYIVW